MLKPLYALAFVTILALFSFAGAGLFSQGAQAQTWSADAAVSRMKDVEKDGEAVAKQGVSTFRKWTLILSAIAFIGLAIATAFGHFKLGWATKWLASTLGLAMASAIIFIVTGLTLVF
jgi:hypothetical protein